jgi:hypothetical protein
MRRPSGTASPHTTHGFGTGTLFARRSAYRARFRPFCAVSLHRFEQ